MTIPQRFYLDRSDIENSDVVVAKVVFGYLGQADTGTFETWLYSLAIQADGKIVAAGTSGFDKFALARYLAAEGGPEARL